MPAAWKTYEAAIAHFQKALQIKPDDVNVRQNLERVMALWKALL
jgi:Flp pilus assembly protein TadD